MILQDMSAKQCWNCKNLNVFFCGTSIGLRTDGIFRTTRRLKPAARELGLPRPGSFRNSEIEYRILNHFLLCLAENPPIRIFDDVYNWDPISEFRHPTTVSIGVACVCHSALPKDDLSNLIPFGQVDSLLPLRTQSIGTQYKRIGKTG